MNFRTDKCCVCKNLTPYDPDAENNFYILNGHLCSNCLSVWKSLNVLQDNYNNTMFFLDLTGVKDIVIRELYQLRMKYNILPTVKMRFNNGGTPLAKDGFYLTADAFIYGNPAIIHMEVQVNPKLSDIDGTEKYEVHEFIGYRMKNSNYRVKESILLSDKTISSGWKIYDRIDNCHLLNAGTESQLNLFRHYMSESVDI